MIKGWHTRGYLPHYDTNDRTQFVTIRLHDSLPTRALDAMKDELRMKNARGIDDLELQRRIEKFLDTGHGDCWLRRPEVADVIERKLLELNEETIDLRAWAIMPNHGHLLFRTINGSSMTTVIQQIKGATSREVNRLLGRSGPFWMRDYFDRFIRDHAQYLKTVKYIEENPVKAGLCNQAEDWRYGSAWRRARFEAEGVAN